MKHALLSLATLLFAGHMSAQIQCGHDHERQRAIANDPTYLAREAALYEELRELIQTQAALRDGDEPIVIPTVFHIIHQKGSENISNARVLQAMEDLTQDFTGSHPDLAGVISQFQPIIGDCKIEFRLATKDRFGNCHLGITRTRHTQTFLGEATSKLNQWPRNQYFNIWVCRNLPPGVAGYVVPPGATEGIAQFLDGIMVLASSTGVIGSLNGRHTISHEAGHMFSLSHTWGATNDPGVGCGDDEVADTPETAGSVGFACNLSLSNCNPPIIENVQNIMDYSSCPRMFTEGQCVRARALLSTNTAERNSLYTEANLQATGVADGYEATCAPEADFYAVVGASLENPAVPFSPLTCTGTTVRFVDNSTRALPTNWAWTFVDGNPGTSNEANPTVTFDSPGWKRVTLTVSNDAGSTTRTDDYAVLVDNQGSAWAEGFYEGFEGPGTELWPLIHDNHSENHTSWRKHTGAGHTGNSCARLNSGDRNNFDFLVNPDNVNDYDDLITPTLDLSMLGSGTYLTFYYSYSTQTTTLANVTERLEIARSTDCGRTWTNLTNGSISGAPLIVNGNATTGPGNWTLRSFLLPQSVLSPTTRFRFRFVSSEYSNDLWIDDINVGGPVGILERTGNTLINLFPNPTSDVFTLNVAGMDELPTEVSISDVRGALVYQNLFAPVGDRGIQLDARDIGLAQGMYVLRVSNELGTGGSRLAVGR